MRSRQATRRAPRDLQVTVLVALGLVVFAVVVYVVVVLGGGALIGHTSSPHLGLSVLATAVVALAFEPVERRIEERVRSRLHRGRSSPYDVLTRLANTNFPSDELPDRMALVLAEGTGAEWTQVWLVVGDRLTLAGCWPRGVTADAAEPNAQHPPGIRSLPVSQSGEQLGVLRLKEREGEPLTAVEERLFAGLAAQAGLVLQGIHLRAELKHRLAEVTARAEELRLSRERLVDAQDAERSRLERDIHDGAQQHLVALAVNLRLAQTLAARSPDRAAKVLSEQAEAARETVRTLVDLSRGIYPTLLSQDGLEAALAAAAEVSPLTVTVSVDVERHAEKIEAAVYFCCLEALQNAAKHSGADQVAVTVRTDAGNVVVVIEDDGHGFDTDAAPAGVGLPNMRDRIESAGGVLTVSSTPGSGTRVEARLPALHVPRQRGG